MGNAGYELLQNKPNPFMDQTTLGFYLPNSAQASLTIYDSTGKTVWEEKGLFKEGYNAVRLSRSDLPSPGLYYYTLESGQYQDTRKLLLHE